MSRNHKKTRIILFLISLIFLSLYILMAVTIHQRQIYLKYCPTNQLNTIWLSADKNIQIVVSENYKAKIYFKKIDPLVAYRFSDGLDRKATVHAPLNEEIVGDIFYLGERYETWKFIEVTENSFTVVVEETSFFEIGDELRFYKVSSR